MSFIFSTAKNPDTEKLLTVDQRPILDKEQQAEHSRQSKGLKWKSTGKKESQ